MYRHAISAPSPGDFFSYEFRHETAAPDHESIFRAIGETMDSRWSHALPPDVFLRTFLPVEKKGMPAFTEARKNKIEKVFTEHQSERQRYGPLITALEDYCPTLKLTNTDHHPETTKWDNYSVGVEPDITGYDNQNLPPTGIFTSLARAEIIIELKTKLSHDPCAKDLTATISSLQYSDHDTQEAIKTRDQISAYAGIVMSSQFRTHFFSVIILGEYARLLRWDRAGATISGRFHIWRSGYLVQFLWRYDSADRETRGHDPCVERLNEKEESQMKHVCKTRLVLGMDRREPVFQFTIHDEHEEEKVHVFLGGKIANQSPPTPRGRCTRGFLVTTSEAIDGNQSVSFGHPVYYLKSTWRIVTSLLETEGCVYKKLQAAKVPHIPTLITSGDAKGKWQITYTDPEWFKEHPPVRQHHNYYVVFKEVGSSLLKFKSQSEFLGAMRDALKAHQVAYCDARILHRDISAGNILIYNGGGLLIDWEFSKPVDPDGVPTPRQNERTGTWQFMSVRILKAGGKGITHTLTDDLESFFHVLCWVALQCVEHALSSSDTAEFLWDVYDYFFYSNGDDKGGVHKGSAIKEKRFTKEVNFTSRPLARLVTALEDAFCTWYQNNDKEEAFSDPRTWSKEDVLTWIKNAVKDVDAVEKINASNLRGESLVHLNKELLNSMGITESSVQWKLIDAVGTLKKLSSGIDHDQTSNLKSHDWTLERFSELADVLSTFPAEENPPALNRSGLQEAVKKAAPENARKEKKRKTQWELLSQRTSHSCRAGRQPVMYNDEDLEFEPVQKKQRRDADQSNSQTRQPHPDTQPGTSRSSGISDPPQTESNLRRSARIRKQNDQSGSPSDSQRRRRSAHGG